MDEKTLAAALSIIAEESATAAMGRRPARYRQIQILSRYLENLIRVVYSEILIGGVMTTRTARLQAPGDFGLAIQQARIARGMTQTELAHEIGVTQSTISAIEAGQTTILLTRILELADSTGISLTASWEDDGAPRG